MYSAPNTTYQNQLLGQVTEKLDTRDRVRMMEEEQQSQHFQSWDTFWGRPGYGAPRDSIMKENLIKNLYFADDKKTVPNVELITLERLPVKF